MRVPSHPRSVSIDANLQLAQRQSEAPYGDDFQDQEWISKGVAYAKRSS